MSTIRCKFLFLLVRHKQAHAKTVIVANIPRQGRLHVQIAQQTPSLQPVLLPVQRVVWVGCFTFKALLIHSIQPETSGTTARHARRLVGLTFN